ncbi:hypothetical protein IWX78_003190 [Mycetocola sp. CAN_C7]|uniref:hypothetical protein n=1 Tax=Mycetocola sp. CAN_C7 TaxID=2787724 RepID=UPI0018CBE47B
MGSKDDALHTSTTERMQAMMVAARSAEGIKSSRSSASELGQGQVVELAVARSIVDKWPEAPKGVAQKLLEHYGAPNEATATKLFWYRTGPWSRMEVTADEIVHNFPAPHTDFLSQYVDYPIPADAASALVGFDGSMLLDRTAGQLGARCDAEAANTVTLNLAVEIMEGRKTVDQARHDFAESQAAFAMGRDAPYAEGLLFEPASATADPDETMIGHAVLDQIGEKLKDVIGAGDTPTS